MKRLLALLIAILTIVTATAQVEHSIILDQSSVRAVQSDALTGVNIDKIGDDTSRKPCARVKIKFANMSRAEVDALDVKFQSNTDLAKRKVAEYYDNVLILEITAKPNTRFYVKSPDFGESNEVTLNLEAYKEYEMEARLNQSFSIVVNSNVEGAEVYIDGNMRGRIGSGLSLTISEVTIGAHTLKLVYGGVSSEQKIDVNKSSISFRHNVDVAASEPQFVVFAVEPQSAVVIIDNKHYTLTEGAMRVVLPAGNYNYTVTAAGYHSQSGTFAVAGDKVTKQIALTADAATVTLTAPDGAEIWVNEEYKGKGSWRGVLNSGTYIFEARKQGHKSSVISKQITSTRPTQSYALPAPQPIYGSIMVDGTPLMADVALDGTPIGQTPLKKGGILIGNHTLTISKDGYVTDTQNVTITEGQTAVVDVALTKQATSELKGVTPIKIDTSLTAEQLNSKGWEYYNKNEYNSAVQYYYESAKRGYAKAQCNLGYCYEYGLGVTKDEYEAVKWYRKSAEQGNAFGQYNLGVSYEKGRGVIQDYYEAVKWYRRSAEQGNAFAQNNLGYCYEKGRGVIQDYYEAVKWYRKSAEQGCANAQDNLGLCYENGQGVTRDYYEAVKWYRKSAEQGNVWAQCKLGSCYEKGRGVTKDIAEAVKWYRKAAEQGDTDAKKRLAKLGY